MGFDFNMCLMVPSAAWLAQGIIGGTKPIASERSSEAHVFLEHQSTIKFLSQSVDSKETLDTDNNLCNLKIPDSGALVTLFAFSLAIYLSFIVTLIAFSETCLIDNICWMR